MKTCLVDPMTDARWLQLVEKRGGDLFHTPEWMKCIAQTYDFRMAAQLLLDDNGHPIAGIPFCEVDDIRGRRRITLPFCDYCDPLTGNLCQWTTLTDVICDQSIPYTIRCLHNITPLQDDRFVVVNRARWHGLGLTDTAEQLWKNLDASARRAIRKAERSKVEVGFAEQIDELRAFYAMHLGVRKHKYQMLAQPYAFFENIWHNFIQTGNGSLLIARHNGRVIGGTVLLQWQDKLYYKFNASISTQADLRPNDLMIWHAIQHAKKSGATYLDFGLSDWDQIGLIRYKRKYATDEKTIHFLGLSSVQATCPQTNAIRTLLPQLTHLLTDEGVPDAITEQAGDRLYRYFA